MTLLKCHEDLKHHHQNEKTVLQELEEKQGDEKSLGLSWVAGELSILIRIYLYSTTVYMYAY